MEMNKMNTQEYINWIEKQLNILSERITERAKLNILDLNIFAENFYRDLLNLLYGYQLENANKKEHNCKGIDLIDKHNNIFIQVTSNTSNNKINKSLEMAEKYFQEHEEYCGKDKVIQFKMLYIGKEDGNFNNIITKKNFNFTKEDIINKSVLIKAIKDADIDKINDVYILFKKYFNRNNDSIKLSLDILNTYLNIEESELDDPFIESYGNVISFVDSCSENYSCKLFIENSGCLPIRKIEISNFTVRYNLDSDEVDIFSQVFAEYSFGVSLNNLINIGKVCAVNIEFDNNALLEEDISIDKEMQIDFDITLSNENESNSYTVIIVMKKSDDIDGLCGKYKIEYLKLF